MAGESVFQKWSGRINQVVIGQESEALKVGGEEGLPFLFKEAKMPNKPRIAFEVWDIPPVDWPQELTSSYEGVLGDTLKWVNLCVHKHKAELICLRLQGTHPDFGDKTKEAAAGLVSQILDNINVPLIILGCGDDIKDNQVMPVCCQAARTRRCLVGEATQNNYKTLAVAALADDHSIIAQSPIDINIAKQLNILISDMGIPAERIVINPTIGALGYGLEYAYSIMERARLAALSGDKMLAMPFIGMVGQEAWRVKEARATEKEFPQWGREKERGIIWEATTAVALLQAGADILVMRHPTAIENVREYIKEGYKNEG
ncbi:MAG: acetyl-CoA decarbonylase/synthase complex subunit delta [Candidatus Omnitrophota bacterium]